MVTKIKYFFTINFCSIPQILAVAGIVSAQMNDEHVTDDLHHWTYYMIATTLATVPYSFFGTAAVVLLVKSKK